MPPSPYHLFGAFSLKRKRHAVVGDAQHVELQNVLDGLGHESALLGYISMMWSWDSRIRASDWVRLT
jgi:hypothetical protein